MARKISFEEVVREANQITSEVPGVSTVAYTFRRTLDVGDGPFNHYHTIPLAAVADAMTNFGFTSEEALEYFVMGSEAALFPEEGAAAFAASPTTVMEDRDTELLEIFDAATEAVRQALNSAAEEPTAFSALAGPPVDAVAALVFETVNPGEGPATVLRATPPSDYEDKRASVKEGRMSVMQANYSVDKERPAWAAVRAHLARDAKMLDDTRKVISTYRYKDFIKEAASRAFPQKPPKPTPSPDPQADPGQLATTSDALNGVNSSPPPAGDQSPDPVNPSEEEGEGS